MVLIVLIALLVLIVIIVLIVLIVLIVIIVGVGQEGRTKNGSWGYLNIQHSLIQLHLGLLALCRWTLGGERHRFAVACCPDKLGTGPMAIDVMGGRRRVKREAGRRESRE